MIVRITATINLYIFISLLSSNIISERTDTFFLLPKFWCCIMWLIWITVFKNGNLIYMGPMFFLHWMYHIFNMKLINPFLPDWIFFCYVSQWKLILVLCYYFFKWEMDEKSHLGLDGVFSALVFLAAVLESKPRMQPKTNFNIF